eukprot:418731_1
MAISGLDNHHNLPPLLEQKNDNRFGTDFLDEVIIPVLDGSEAQQDAQLVLDQTQENQRSVNFLTTLMGQAKKYKLDNDKEEEIKNTLINQIYLLQSIWNNLHEPQFETKPNKKSFSTQLNTQVKPRLMNTLFGMLIQTTFLQPATIAACLEVKFKQTKRGRPKKDSKPNNNDDMDLDDDEKQIQFEENTQYVQFYTQTERSEITAIKEILFNQMLAKKLPKSLLKPLASLINTSLKDNKFRWSERMNCLAKLIHLNVVEKIINVAKSIEELEYGKMRQFVMNIVMEEFDRGWPTDKRVPFTSVDESNIMKEEQQQRFMLNELEWLLYNWTEISKYTKLLKRDNSNNSNSNNSNSNNNLNNPN